MIYMDDNQKVTGKMRGMNRAELPAVSLRATFPRWIQLGF